MLLEWLKWTNKIILCFQTREILLQFLKVQEKNQQGVLFVLEEKQLKERNLDEK